MSQKPNYTTDFWKKILDRLKEEINPDEKYNQVIKGEFPDVEPTQPFYGSLELFAFEIISCTDSPLFNELNLLLFNEKAWRKKLKGELIIRRESNSEVVVSYTPFSWEVMMNRYRDYQDRTQMADEVYKWRLVKTFQTNWNRYDKGELTFQVLVNITDWSNLVYKMFSSNFKYLVEQKPQEVEASFKLLFDLESDFQERITQFLVRLSELHGQVKTKAKDKLFLSEREISTILTYRYPEKYCFFMPKFYEPLTRLLNREKSNTGYQLADYYEIVSEFKEHILPQYEDVVSVKNRITANDEFYTDDQHLLIIQDIFFVTLAKKQKLKETNVKKNETDGIFGLYSSKEIAEYFAVLDSLVSNFALNQSDQRLVFSTSENRLNFIVGQRYTFTLHPPAERKKEAVFSIISSKPFTQKNEQFDGQPLAYFNRMDTVSHSQSVWEDINLAYEIELNRSKKSSYLKHDSTELRKMVFDRDYRNERLAQLNLSYPEPIEMVKEKHSQNMSLNTILFGPPGTGKTYNTIDLAVSIAANNRYKEGAHASNKAIFDELMKLSQIEFITFHQSFTYEDFVEGIKPRMGNLNTSDVSYCIDDGVFKRICASANKSTEEKSFDQACSEFVNWVNEENGFTLKTPSHQKPFDVRINGMGNFVATPRTGVGTEMVITKEFLRDYIYNGEIRDWKPYLIPIANHFRENYFKANGSSGLDDNRKKNFVLIIDEINRGNISQIFGELITLIENDKREGMPNALTATLPYSKDAFCVPPNLYIIGTMNTADRSVEALDTALRRRFSFKEMPPKYDLEELSVNVGGVVLSVVLKTINERIEKLLDKDHLIGHSYFIGVDSEADLVMAFNDRIVPLLQEYFYNDFAKIGMVLGKGFVERKTNTVKFADFKGGLNGDFDDREVFEIKRVSKVTLKQALDSLLNRTVANQENG